MHSVYVACLFGGALATALFALLGRVGGAGGHAAHLPGGHAHVGHLGGPHGHSGPSAHHHPVTAGHATASGRLSVAAGWTLSWLSPLTLAAFALWFGAAGLILEGALPALTVVVAVVAGLAGAALVRLAMRAFIRASTPPLALTSEGAIGTVNASIRTDGPGEVICTLEGLHRSFPAYSVDGKPIPRGATVVVLRREKGFAWVQSLDPLTEHVDESTLAAPSGSDESS